MVKREDVLKRICENGVLPVAIISDSSKAEELSRAMFVGGIDIIEVALRTEEALSAIKAISEKCPEMMVGAGTVISLEQCKEAVASGANFIVTPGFCEEIVAWCAENEVLVIPGCVTPTEIMRAMKYGLTVLKFFPNDGLGGVDVMRSLVGPFPIIQFIPTGGINIANCAEYIRLPFVFALGGSWVCPEKDIAANNYEHITRICQESRKEILGFEFGHLGINAEGPEDAKNICMQFHHAFGFEYRPGSGTSDFASNQFEIKKSDGKGKNGHIAIATNSIECAIGEMRRRGVEMSDEKSYKNGRLNAVWLKDEIGGFAIHLLAK